MATTSSAPFSTSTSPLSASVTPPRQSGSAADGDVSPTTSTPANVPRAGAAKRRNSIARGGPIPHVQTKIGPQRTSKVSQKLKILPSPADQDEESGRDVYSQVTRIKDSTARRDAERLGKAERAQLPRVTAYATANSYDLDGLMKFLKARASTRGSAPRKFDECIFTPFSYSFSKQAALTPQIEDLINLHEQDVAKNMPTPAESEQQHPGETDDVRDDRSLYHFVEQQNRAISSSDVFLFQYGVVVIWGMSVEEESRFLRDIAKFETEKLGEDDVQVENFNFYVTSSYQPRIYNDFITLKDGRNYMVKLSISHAIAQSVKISLFEDLVDNTIEDTKSIPADIATSGKVKMSRRDIMKHIGELFILRININLQGSVLDSPELMWAEPQLEPVYQAARSYLEINQRLSLLNQRLDVIGDLLQMLKEQMSHSQGEHLEWIVIILIAAEILVAVINVVVDLMAAS
ncbi:hypothetical protein BZA05DRAFT_402080 [Tricharina praecox]|uniref:uncharacterized protein n=1 Tax=Tricharina praecox TaxID=43433 RepID=UPI002220631B|nr:uncharacterized protein BZA05DRAFT_402080 [Tricharina praecox]KAI5849051.1 hypothetical protein BZA05DRAFT_402080 [Tricharina praecox]